MAIGVGKRDLHAIVTVLDRLDGTPEECALAVWDEVVRLYEAKARYVAVGQLLGPDGKPVENPDRRAEDVTKLAIGPYGTYKQALDAVDSMVFNKLGQELYRAWAVRLDHHSTPFQYFRKRKAELDKERLKSEGPKPYQRALVLMGDLPPEDWAGFAPEPKTCEHCGSVLNEPEEELSTEREQLS